jgi:hypothetical protein
MGQGYWPSPMPWGAPPRRQAPPPFGLPPLRMPPLRPTTFTPPTVRQIYVKICFVCLLDYFAFLTRWFTCLSGWLRITTKWQTRLQFHWRPLQLGGRIRWQRCSAIVLVLFVFEIFLSCRAIILSCQTCFDFDFSELYCLVVIVYVLYILPILEAPCLGRQPKQTVVKKPYIHRLSDKYNGLYSSVSRWL